MNPFLSNLIRIIRKEIWSNWKIAIFIYIVTSFAFLAAAIYWPRIFSSSSVVIVDEETILSPLMRGTAVTTEVADQSRMARQIILSKKSIEKVLKINEWLGDDYENASAKEIDRLSRDIENNINIRNAGSNLIEISFNDVDPFRAFNTVKYFTDIFIEESAFLKKSESRGAYQFIDDQVSIYHKNLKTAEEKIKEFRSNNIDASPEAKNNANQRLIQLNREVEETELSLAETNSELQAKLRQLSGGKGVENTASIQLEAKLNQRIDELQIKLDDLQLNYKDTYPDIVQIKGQIESLKKQIEREYDKRKQQQSSGVKGVPTGTAAQALRGEILVLENRMGAQKSRVNQINTLIDKEKTRLASINAVEAEIAELTRDYTVNQNMYQSLLEQRESARISMNIDIQEQGSIIRIQEPAALPVTPTGLRFIHIILGGLVLSFLIPIGVIYGFTLLDQKLRSEYDVFENIELPILASVYGTSTPREKQKNIVKFSLIVFFIATVWCAYGYAIYLRLQGQ